MSNEVSHILATELSRKRKNKTTYRVKPSECPLGKKYCYVKTIELKNNNTSEEKLKCNFLEEIGIGNELGICVIKCSCSNSVKYIFED